MVSELKCTTIMEDFSKLFVQFSNLPTIMKPSLVPRVPRDQGFLRPCPQNDIAKLQLQTVANFNTGKPLAMHSLGVD